MSLWASLGSAAIQAASAYAANQANIKNQNDLFDAQVNLANTGHQREVADLRLAGLNPILSAMSSSGSATPSPEAATQKSVGENAVQSALQAIALDNQTKVADAQMINAQTNAWQVYDAKEMGRAGFDVLGWGLGGKSERVQTIRVNKVTGECFTLDGRRVKVLDLPDMNSGKSVPDGEVTVKYEYPDVSRKRKQSIGQNMTEDFHRAYDRRYRNPDIFRKGR